MSSRWWWDAACRDTDPELFFTEAEGARTLARRRCRPCPVRVECLRDAMHHGEEHGIWGGTSPAERRKLATFEAAR
ncbi:WhiB family transcriptional regulator [Nonomuraea sp. NBC_01738]|uniref:WhiB family transcriptional regulator n=1 Tax=Nonomuraea sp. NBC_01738 TaxID=2976003 RepID=UPI002E0D4373|nr:WhiB family transcriptional regulator [Nonomuraea sp. NBC_01738]